MLTSITLENFKGIGTPVTIPLRPLTIMFGKNSAGKSTIVQALHYAREILWRNNLNADRTLFGGDVVDLGGFRNLVHNRDLSNEMRLIFELDLSYTDLPTYGFESNYFHANYTKELDLSGEVLSATVALSINWSESLRQPIITEYRTSLNNEDIAVLETSADGRQTNLSFNADHDLFTDIESNLQIGWQKVPLVFTNLTESLPYWGKRLEFELDLDDDFFTVALGDLRASQALIAPGEILRDWLINFRYIGPLRETPPRAFQPNITADENNWANGSAAWRELYQGGKKVVQQVSYWLSDENLKTGYKMDLQQFREILLESPLMVALANNTVIDDIADTSDEIKQYPICKRLVLVEEKSGLLVLPNDIGIGISQVVPIVVAAIDSTEKMIAIEQPELHLHPAVQAELGDLFIESALGETNNRFLIETHSEHLILRILRRIREQAEGENDENSIEITPEDVSLLYIEATENGTVVHELPITEEGDFEDTIPGGFFAERANELF